MELGEKLRTLRKRTSLTQKDVADHISISIKTYANYENGIREPSKKAIYSKLAELFNVNINDLLHDNDEFLIDAREKYGSKGAREANEILEKAGCLFAGGELSEQDKDAVMRSLQTLYWDAKEDCQKFTPNKYKKNKFN